MAKAYYRAGEFKQETLDARVKTFERGYDIGFHSAYNYISLKKKYVSYIYSFPFSGKTSLVFDTYMHIAKKYGAKIAIYSPEAGGRNALVSYLVQVFLGKKLHGSMAQEATDEEWDEAIAFVDAHFLLLVPKLVGKDKILFDTREMFAQVHAAEQEYGWKIDILLADPYNQLSKNELERKKTIADFTLENLTYINQVADEMDMHIQIAMHLRDEESQLDKETGIEYMSKPYPHKLANGQSVWRVAQTMIGLQRLPAGVIEKTTGVPYPENATDLHVQKQKVFGAGEVGSFRLFYDDSRQKFYEVIGTQRFYCGEYESRNETPTTSATLKPSKRFSEDIF